MRQILGDILAPTVDYTSTSYGSVLLKSLQTEKLPELDLLVREAVQNSSDASLALTDEKSVWIDFVYKEFDAAPLCEQLGEVGKKILDLHPEYLQSAKFLQIRDRKTTGLTGPYKKGELNASDHGNYFKLIFDSGINQTQTGAGGNWGFGKSVYYRVSRVGIVVYYSQIISDDPLKPAGATEERLVITMVEDETKFDAVLPTIYEHPSGRAWWGRPGTNKGEILPIVNHDDIEAFLNIFGVKPFKKGATGTTVIIPFIDEAKILGDLIPESAIDPDVFDRCDWKDSVPQYIEHALQKWYAPRLGNDKLDKLGVPGKRIRAAITSDAGTTIPCTEEMPPFFLLVQDLYNAALFAVNSTEPPTHHSRAAIKTKEIRTKNEGLEGPQVVGYVAYCKVGHRDIYNKKPGLDPYVLTGNFNNDGDVNEPIVMFAREPGMIISYSIDGTWSKGVKAPPKNGTASQDEYIVAFFVPLTNKPFKQGSKAKVEGYDDIGAYIKACEDSDHANWEDKAKFKLISKMKTNVARKIAEGTKENDPSTTSASASRLSSRLGKALMPSKGLLATPSTTPKGKGRQKGGSNGSTSGGRTTFIVKDPIWRNSSLIIPFELGMGNNRKRTIQLEALTETGSISAKTWHNDIGRSFPAELSAATATIYKLNDESDVVHCSPKATTCQSGPLHAELLSEHGSIVALAISCDIPGQLVIGELEVNALDKTFDCVLKAR